MPRDTENPRSRSPYHRERTSRNHHHHHQHRRRSRSRSPHRSKNNDGQHEQPIQRQQSQMSAVNLPLGARPLSKHDLRAYRPMFALYLDIQKQKDIDDLTDDEVRGRWKSFLGKWNRGELAEGWYDPETLEKAIAAESSAPRPNGRFTALPDRAEDKNFAGELDEDDYGPSLPRDYSENLVAADKGTAKPGPSIPSIQDLRAAHEQRREETEAEYEQRLRDIRSERRHDRKLQKSRLDDLTPRAEAGTRERQLERKRELADSNRAFAAAKDTTGDVDLPDQEVLGDEDSLGQLKRMQKEAERKKNDREIRREEVLRARIAEREERVKGMKEKEEKTMASLKEIARARFGAG